MTQVFQTTNTLQSRLVELEEVTKNEIKLRQKHVNRMMKEVSTLSEKVNKVQENSISSTRHVGDSRRVMEDSYRNSRSALDEYASKCNEISEVKSQYKDISEANLKFRMEFQKYREDMDLRLHQLQYSINKNMQSLQKFKMKAVLPKQDTDDDDEESKTNSKMVSKIYQKMKSYHDSVVEMTQKNKEIAEEINSQLKEQLASNTRTKNEDSVVLEEKESEDSSNSQSMPNSSSAQHVGLSSAKLEQEVNSKVNTRIDEFRNEFRSELETRLEEIQFVMQNSFDYFYQLFRSEYNTAREGNDSDLKGKRHINQPITDQNKSGFSEEAKEAMFTNRSNVSITPRSQISSTDSARKPFPTGTRPVAAGAGDEAAIRCLMDEMLESIEECIQWEDVYTHRGPDTSKQASDPTIETQNAKFAAEMRQLLSNYQNKFISLDSQMKQITTIFQSFQNKVQSISQWILSHTNDIQSLSSQTKLHSNEIQLLSSEAKLLSTGDEKIVQQMNALINRWNSQTLKVNALESQLKIQLQMIQMIASTHEQAEHEPTEASATDSR